MKTKYILKLVFLTFIITHISCSESLEEININPNQQVENPSLDLIFAAILPGFINQMTDSYTIPGQLAQQFAIKNSEAGILTHDEDAESRRFWEKVYSENGGALRNTNFLIYEAERKSNVVYEAVGKIYRSYIISYTTDLFGDVPFINAAQGFRFEEQYLFPKYDPQATIYREMLNDLDVANSLLAQAPVNQTIDASKDLLFQGNKEKWRRFANTLRLRLLMRISNVTDINQEVNEIFSNPEVYPIIESQGDQPAFSFNDLNDWPFNENRIKIEDIRISAVAVTIMKGEDDLNQISTQQDPRLAFLLNPTENSMINGSSMYVGQPIGLASDIEDNANRSLLSDDFKKLNTFWLITHAELLLIKSEAITRGFISGNAAETYKKGIEASLQKYGIDITNTESINYLTSLEENFLGNEIKHIAIQRWLDQINNGFEGYSVWRRFGIPVLSLGPDTVTEQIPTRYFYSSKTTDKNQENANEAINRPPLNGINTTFQRVWWDAN